MENNKFEITGRVNYISIKYTESGTGITRVLISKKNKNEEYDAYGINLIGKVAEDIYTDIKKGDYANITGKITVNKYKDKSGKDVERLELLGFEYKKAKYDENVKGFVEDTSKGGEAEPWA